MKPALYYTILGRNFPYGSFCVLAVTSEGPRGRINGRELPDNAPTHTTSREVHGRFNTEAEASKLLAQIKKIKEKHAPLIEFALNDYSLAQKIEWQEIKQAIKEGMRGD